MPSASRTIMSPALSIRSFPESVVYASPATATSTTSGIRSARRSCPEVRTKLSSSAVNMAATSAEGALDRPPGQNGFGLVDNRISPAVPAEVLRVGSSHWIGIDGLAREPLAQTSLHTPLDRRDRERLRPVRTTTRDEDSKDPIWICRAKRRGKCDLHNVRTRLSMRRWTNEKRACGAVSRVHRPAAKCAKS